MSKIRSNYRKKSSNSAKISNKTVDRDNYTISNADNSNETATIIDSAIINDNSSTRTSDSSTDEYATCNSADEEPLVQRISFKKSVRALRQAVALRYDPCLGTRCRGSQQSPLWAYERLLRRNERHCNQQFHSYSVRSKLEASLVHETLWTVSEKLRFFAALARFGRLQLNDVQRFVGTKSLIEVASYCRLLHDESARTRIQSRQGTNSRRLRRYDQMPIAYEMSAEWVAIEEQLSRSVRHVPSLKSTKYNCKTLGNACEDARIQKTDASHASLCQSYDYSNDMNDRLHRYRCYLSLDNEYSLINRLAIVRMYHHQRSLSAGHEEIPEQDKLHQFEHQIDTRRLISPRTAYELGAVVVKLCLELVHTASKYAELRARIAGSKKDPKCIVSTREVNLALSHSRIRRTDHLHAGSITNQTAETVSGPDDQSLEIDHHIDINTTIEKARHLIERLQRIQNQSEDDSQPINYDRDSNDGQFMKVDRQSNDDLFLYDDESLEEGILDMDDRRKSAIHELSLFRRCCFNKSLRPMAQHLARLSRFVSDTAPISDICHDLFITKKFTEDVRSFSLCEFNKSGYNTDS